MWISKDRFVELEEKYKDLEEKYNRIERILEHSDGEITCRSYSDGEYYVYINGKEYQLKIPDYFCIYDLEKIDGQDEIIKIKCFGNLSARKCYLVDLKSADTWEEFIERYTENKHIVNSKYIRQVILGNCNPKRQVTYEKYLMGLVLEVLIDELGYSASDIAFFSNDEIVIDMGKYEDCINKQKILEMVVNVRFNIPFMIELFYLHKITGTDGYYKELVKNIIERKYEFKCLNNYVFPFVLRKFNGEEITENDKVFYHEGLLSKFIEIPEISFEKKGDKND